MDVAVLDQNRRPIRGLQPADFTILENGKPQDISVFSAVDVPDVEMPRTSWLRDVSPDVRTNQDLKERRLWLLIVDDATVQANTFALKQIRELTAKVIHKFGPADLGAVVFTMDNRKSVDFTDDRARLLSTVATQPQGFRGMGSVIGDLYFWRSSIETVRRAIEAFGTMTDRRRAIVYISSGVPVNLEQAARVASLGLANAAGEQLASSSGAQAGPSEAAMTGEFRDLVFQMERAFTAASRANVSVYTMDICGLRTAPLPMHVRTAAGGIEDTCVPGVEVDYLQTVAAATGGRAVTNTNDFSAGIDAMFAENSSYYLLGYQPADIRLDGKLRRLEVKVNRPDAFVRARTGFVAEKASDLAKRRAAAEADAVVDALSGLLPRGDLPMRLVAAPFAKPGKKDATVLVMLGVAQPIRETKQRTTEKVDLAVGAYNTDGKQFGGTRIKADVVVRADATGLAEYEVLAKLDLKPGRYQLRMAANVGSLTTSGSLYYDVDVPDFAGEKVSLSGVLVSMSATVPIAPLDLLKNFLPVVPTTERRFTADKLASAFVRIYQGGKKAPLPVPLRISIRNADDVQVVDRTDTISAERFAGPGRAADVTVTLPVGQLDAGEYLLALEASLEGRTATRQLRFSVHR